jgi:hypothetical protein
VEVQRENTTVRQTAVQRARDDGMEPPTCSGKDFWFSQRLLVSDANLAIIPQG